MRQSWTRLCNATKGRGNDRTDFAPPLSGRIESAMATTGKFELQCGTTLCPMQYHPQGRVHIGLRAAAMA